MALGFKLLPLVHFTTVDRNIFFPCRSFKTTVLPSTLINGEGSSHECDLSLQTETGAPAGRSRRGMLDSTPFCAVILIIAKGIFDCAMFF